MFLGKISLMEDIFFKILKDTILLYSKIQYKVQFKGYVKFLTFNQMMEYKERVAVSSLQSKFPRDPYKLPAGINNQ